MTKDEILKEACMIYTLLGVDSTKEERRKAKAQEWEILKKLKTIDYEEYKFYRDARDKA